MLIKIFDLNRRYMKMIKQIMNHDGTPFSGNQNESINVTIFRKNSISSSYINPRTEQHV